MIKHSENTMFYCMSNKTLIFFKKCGIIKVYKYVV